MLPPVVSNLLRGVDHPTLTLAWPTELPIHLLNTGIFGTASAHESHFPRLFFPITQSVMLIVFVALFNPADQDTLMLTMDSHHDTVWLPPLLRRVRRVRNLFAPDVLGPFRDLVHARDTILRELQRQAAKAAQGVVTTTFLCVCD